MMQRCKDAGMQGYLRVFYLCIPVSLYPCILASLTHAGGEDEGCNLWRGWSRRGGGGEGD